ncbi:hypothetical protein RSJ42_04660 [Methanosarcina hadiensis]|uniref:hypothetical protein n=1 Tax=Methanosarcina hadiensis TaxID=3078083 RepID=UPI003977C15C
MQKIQSKEYFDAVQAYFVNHKDPARVYSFLLNTLWTHKHKLSDKMYYERVDTLKMTDNCVSFYTGTECALVLCSNTEKTES